MPARSGLVERLRLLPMPGPGLRRKLIVAGRPDDGGTIVAVVQQASIRALADHCLPALRALLPDMGDTIMLAEPGAARLAEPRLGRVALVGTRQAVDLGEGLHQVGTQRRLVCGHRFSERQRLFWFIAAKIAQWLSW